MAGKRVRLTVENVKAAAPGDRELHVWDSVVAGFALRLRPPSPSHPKGAKSFVYVYRWPKGRGGKKQRVTLGPADQWAVGDARTQADAYASEVRQGRDPRAAIQAQKAAVDPANTFGRIAGQFLEKHSANNRSHSETERIFNVYVLPRWKRKSIADIRRIDVVTLLDAVADNNGLVMADRVLAAVRKLFNWYAVRDDSFRTPIVKGMNRTRPKDRRRKRALTDDEIRKIWKASEQMRGPYGALVRFAFLTAARREEISQASRPEIEGDLWVIPGERTKNAQPHFLPLSQAAQDVVASLPIYQIDGKPSPWLFTYDGRKHFNSHSEAKAEMDKLSGVENWVLHDVRRTSRTLLSRAGIQSEIAERILNHSQGDLEETYNRHSFLPEKRHAMNALASELDRIVNPHAVKVIPLRRKRKGSVK